VLLHLAVDGKQSRLCWEAVLEHMKQRGPSEPLLVGPSVHVLESNTGVRKAVRRERPASLEQRCQVHELCNALAKLPRLARPTLKS